MKNLSTLAEQLKLRIESDRQAIEKSTSDALKKHERALSELSRSALNTTKSVMQSELQMFESLILKAREKVQSQLTRDYERASHEIQNQSDQLSQQVRNLVRIVKMQMLLPAASLVIFLLSLALLFVTSPSLMREQTKSVFIDGEKYTVITSPDWTTCKIGLNHYPCRKEK